MDYSKHFSVNKAKQGSPIPGRESEMIENSCGSYVFDAGHWERLRRFLIIGTEGGTYYADESTLTVENAKSIVKCIKEDGREVLNILADVSLRGRAPKNDPAIFTLALLCTFADQEVKSLAYKAIPTVCRIGTHLFTFMTAIKSLRKWSSGLKRGVAKYYLGKSDHRLELDLLKYKGRNGWTHRDVLRLAHVKPNSDIQDSLFSIAAGNGPKTEGQHPLYQASLEANRLLSESKDKKTVNKVADLVLKYELTREMLPTEALKYKEVWEALLVGMPLGALVRNLGKMTSVGLLTSNFDAATKIVMDKLSDSSILKRSRMHPVSILNALATYGAGRGLRGSLTWDPVSKIQEALGNAFYMSFDYVEPTGKNILLCLDVSASMGWGSVGGSFLSAREVAAAIAMTFVKTEDNVDSIAFSGNVINFPLHKNMSLGEIVKKMSNMPFGPTDCSAAIRYALDKMLPVDAFLVLTDNETNARHSNHASTSLGQFRHTMGRNAKMAVAGFTATSASIADPKDSLMMDCVGFDSALPQVISEFIRS